MLKFSALTIFGVSPAAKQLHVFLYLLLFRLHVLQRLSSLGIKLRLWIDSIARVVFSVVHRRFLGGKVASRGKTWTEKIVVKRQRETNQLTGSYRTSGPRA